MTHNIPTDFCPFCNAPLKNKAPKTTCCLMCFRYCLYFNHHNLSVDGYDFVIDDVKIMVDMYGEGSINRTIISKISTGEALIELDYSIIFNLSSLEQLRQKINMMITFQ